MHHSRRTAPTRATVAKPARAERRRFAGAWAINFRGAREGWLAGLSAGGFLVLSPKGAADQTSQEKGQRPSSAGDRIHDGHVLLSLPFRRFSMRIRPSQSAKRVLKVAHFMA